MAVGACRPDWAEIDSEIWNESLVFVDSYAGAKAESGDLILSNCSIQDELGNFIHENEKIDSNKRTAFKSLGLAIEDLVAAKMAMENIKKSSNWPIDFVQSEEVEKLKEKCGKSKFHKTAEVSNAVRNLKCSAFLLTSDLMVCEMKTSFISLALIYKAKTGQLQAILNIKDLQDELKTDLYTKYL